jgi:penicillin-binding protein 1C
MTRWRRIAIGFAGAAAVIAIAAGGWLVALGPPPGKNVDTSHSVLDREGRLLRAYATNEGRWRLPAAVEDVDPRFLTMLFAYEDKRFRSHLGVDPFAMGRAAVQFAGSGHIVSGGSTLTMQVARLMEPREQRSLIAKLRQATRALQLEFALSKDDILALYLTLAPYGGNLEGIRAASLSYLGKEPRRLTLGEAALLVALPQSPELRRPDRNPAIARAARDRVLDRVALAGAVPMDEIARAKMEGVPVARRELPVLAPHASDQVVAAEPALRTHTLTIDAPLQKTLQELARERAVALGPTISVAIIAVDNATGEVRARVGSADYFGTRRAGQVDMTNALRSPGSTLKPFIYGLGFEDGLIHPETLIDDRPTRYGNYTPENFDLTFQGTVTVRKALQLSLNVPAIAVLGKVGVNRLSARLTQTGAALVLPKGEAPGLAMGLGGVGIKLTDLTMLYTGLARGGMATPLLERSGPIEASPRRLLDPVAAWYVGNVLMGAPPPENAPHGRIAFKTGTSYGYRDAWAIGYDGKTVIGVWVGRPDGVPVPGISGIVAAAPILFESFDRLGAPTVRLRPAPAGAIVASNSQLPSPLRRFRHPDLQMVARDAAPEIAFPADGVDVDLGAASGSERPLMVKVRNGVPPFTFFANGAPFGRSAFARQNSWKPDGPGYVTLSVVDAEGRSDVVKVFLD